jgi:hypothetical protein
VGQEKSKKSKKFKLKTYKDATKSIGQRCPSFLLLILEIVSIVIVLKLKQAKKKDVLRMKTTLNYQR